VTDWIERNRGHILVLIINLAITGAALFWIQRHEEPQLQLLTPAVETSANPTPAIPGTVRVDVTGAVIRPDVYRLPGGSIVKDAIQAAGGATEDADLARINLATELVDQQQLRVPRIGEVETSSSTGAVEPPATIPASVTVTVNINRASADELASLPGVGPELARRIVEWRVTHGDFKRIEDIKQVRGIGDATFERIKDRITVSE
jgi:competence protein ComEA